MNWQVVAIVGLLLGGTVALTALHSTQAGAFGGMAATAIAAVLPSIFRRKDDGAPAVTQDGAP